MTNTTDDTKPLLAPMGCGLIPPKDLAGRLRTTMRSLEDAMALMGYVPVDSVSIAAFKGQLEHHASADLVDHVSEYKALSVLHLLLKEEHRPAGLDAFYDELVRAAPAVLKIVAETKDPDEWFEEAVAAINAAREVPERF